MCRRSTWGWTRCARSCSGSTPPSGSPWPRAREAALCGAPTLEALRLALDELHRALARHNAREEELLRGTIRRVDAWGDVREMLMDTHHAGEHDGVMEALAYAIRAPDAEAAARLVLPVLERLLAHMDDEEQKILDPRVLTDELVNNDPFGG